MAERVLNLGAGNHLATNAVNHDLIKHRPEIDVAWDLNELPWPWEDGAFDLVLASSVFEHLEIDLLTALNECWRILRPGGQARIKIPYWEHRNAYSDPTHRRPPYDFSVFDAVDPDTKHGKELGYYTERKWKVLKVSSNKERSAVIGLLEVRK